MEADCKACGARFEAEPPFVTCPACRRPLLNDGGGCHFWPGVRDPRVTYASEVPSQSTLEAGRER